MFEPYVDKEYLKVVEYIRTKSSNKLPNFLRKVLGATTIQTNALLADINVDLGKIRDETPEIVDVKQTIDFLDNNLKPLTVSECLNAINDGKINDGDIVRIEAARVTRGPQFLEFDERKIFPLDGSFLEYTTKLENVQIRSIGFMPAEMVDVQEARKKRFVLRVLFRDIQSAKSFFEQSPGTHYAEIFGIVEKMPKYPSQIDETKIVSEMSLGIVTAILRVQIQARDFLIQPKIETTEVHMVPSHAYASSVPVTSTSGSVSIGTFSMVTYEPCFTCPKCGYKYVPFKFPTRCPCCGFSS